MIIERECVGRNEACRSERYTRSRVIKCLVVEMSMIVVDDNSKDLQNKIFCRRYSLNQNQ